MKSKNAEGCDDEQKDAPSAVADEVYIKLKHHIRLILKRLQSDMLQHN
jgi:hypothetical protein